MSDGGAQCRRLCEYRRKQGRPVRPNSQGASPLGESAYLLSARELPAFVMYEVARVLAQSRFSDGVAQEVAQLAANYRRS